MDEPHLYQQIANSIRQQIFDGVYVPGDRIPSVREMAAQWHCTIGTVQRAYQDLTKQGLVVSRPGQGTKVTNQIGVMLSTNITLRRASLVHRAEEYLLEMLTAGYTLPEVESALHQAMERWRTVSSEPVQPRTRTLRFVGSHDLIVTWLAGHFGEIVEGYELSLNFTGSLGGLIALSEGKADFAGSHLWDEESGLFNTPFVRRVLPGKRVALVTLSHRRLGFILPARNPAGIHTLRDLLQSNLRFINRQSGSGTRVWLDATLRKNGIPSDGISGYMDEELTHSAVARAIAEGRADVGIGLEAAARSYGLDFELLTHDRYDLVFPETMMSIDAIQALIAWLGKEDTRKLIEAIGGYDARASGNVEWVDY